MLLPPSLLTFVLLGDFACALRLNFEGRHIPRAQRGLQRRATLVWYTTNITLGGAPFTAPLLHLTPSADLWVAGTVPGAASTGKAASIQYASGGAAGPVKTSELQFSEYAVPKQAFMEVVPDDDHPEGQGLIGLGPSSGSNVFQAFSEATEGLTVLDSIFLQNKETPNYITFALGRLDDPTDFFHGDFTVGELLPNFTDVTNQPKLLSTDVSIGNKGNQHIQILLDANGFIGPDGAAIPIKSTVGSTSNKKQATAIIDTGFSLPQVPKSVASGIYSRFSGAELTNDPSIGNIWYVPCEQEVNITLKFGGVSYPIHPLDTTVDPAIFGLGARKNSKGQNACLGLFQPFSFDTGSNPTYDMILGMAFLRNVYTLIDFGDYVAGSKARDDPYVQFLSITDRAEGMSLYRSNQHPHANPSQRTPDFVNRRLNGIDTTQPVLLSDKTPDDDNDNEPKKSKTLYYIIGGCIIGGLLLIFLVILLTRRRGNKRGVYRPLHTPAPNVMYGQQAPPMTQNYGGPNPPAYNPDRPYDPPQAQTVPYHNPWEHRR
ncbi:aspartic peptidase domain-containing protein [Mycena rebaudengoi]|nr:aspartic peptidase domain-containing protein [Mycena rebaudengoi]